MSNFEGKIYDVTKQAVKEVYGLDVGPDTLVVEVPRNKDNGDYATGVAMKLARELHKNPVEIAEAIAAKLRELLPEAESVMVAKPGFINFKLSSEALTSLINHVLDQGDGYGQNESGKGVRILVEWVSANPTGDLHCGHARNAAWGDSICRLLEKSGYDVLREFYVNDAGNQIVMLGESLVSRYFEFFGKEYPLPENGYHADDVKQIAQDIAREDGDKWLTADPSERLHYFMQQGIDRELAKIDRDLKLYRVNITSWMHETFFYQNDMKRIKDCLKMMDDKGLLYEKDGALWFKSTDYGDDKDRVLRKSDGTLSYLTPDIANHVYKMERGYPVMVNLWGADHHSYVTRMQAALTALGYPKGTLSVELIQMVRMVEDGVEVKMSKRTGNAITLRELCEDVGVDAARWFFVSKDITTQMDFDIKQASAKNYDNPVYYAQYAHSRMCSILRNPEIPAFHREESYGRLTNEKELQLLKMIGEFPGTVAKAAKTRKPNIIAEYILSLVKLYHSYYNVVHVNNPDDPELTNQRLGLVLALKTTLRNALDLLGVDAPQSM
ncbi:arginine--tRNA ligase [Candidatus Allofournierella excrementigallinarum]|uniref:arginine--tRNA ligase n=1 Tax=Candidatus Allofournierella excrementigallinarum TaxID=2838592 RepID=UPI00374E5C50